MSKDTARKLLESQPWDKETELALLAIING